MTSVFFPGMLRDQLLLKVPQTSPQETIGKIKVEEVGK